MTDRTERPPSAFRLNLEQQKNRAKDLLRAAKSGDSQALARLTTGNARPSEPATVKLADAQFAIARELRLVNWAQLKAHIESMDRQRAALERQEPPLDGDLKTLHIRCGSDIRNALAAGGFVGTFLEHSTPYCQGPVTLGPERHELMAHYITDTFGELKGGLKYPDVLHGLEQDDERLRHSADEYERVVMWMEHDSYDQLVLARLLAHYANAPRPRVLELIAVHEFPGGERFIGIGQLPSEALRMLWPMRRTVTPAQLALGEQVWNAIASPDPRQLAALARNGTPALPIMAPALHRHLRELPSVENGLSLTEHLILQVLDEMGSQRMGRILGMLTYGREPLPFMGDWGTFRRIEAMLAASEPVLTRVPAREGEPYFRQEVSLTDLGRAVLRGERDWLSLRSPPRWVGGVQVVPMQEAWRWDESLREALRS
jgi:hypothetical protein